MTTAQQMQAVADLAWAGYDGGLFCLTIGSSFVSQLSTDTIGLLSRSLSLDAFVCLTVAPSNVSLPEVHARLLRSQV